MIVPSKSNVLKLFLYSIDDDKYSFCFGELSASGAYYHGKSILLYTGENVEDEEHSEE